MSEWYASLIGTRCSSCDALLPAASPVRRVSAQDARAVQCATCAKRRHGEDVPSRLAQTCPAWTTQQRQAFVRQWRRHRNNNNGNSNTRRRRR